MRKLKNLCIKTFYVLWGALFLSLIPLIKKPKPHRNIDVIDPFEVRD